MSKHLDAHRAHATRSHELARRIPRVRPYALTAFLDQELAVFRTTFTTALLAGATLLAGCDATPATRLAGPPVLSVSSDASPDAGLTESVTGHGAIDFVIGRDDISFVALRHDDGSLSGEFTFHEHLKEAGTQTHTYLHGRVTCFVIVGNRARVGGVTETPPDNSSAFALWWEVVDNGEGANSPPDEWARPGETGAPGAEQAFCDSGGTNATTPVTEGNFQVRPSAPASGG
jgi:hypothetical protein